ncbi:hypothetical protein L2E82_49404 [Cichorium intybus]|uniref:Uncharacterized protein n=1 Tax=Cichorium intybus TaxID=13427 RepID=A0ACB8Z1N4_CICIN|nr:hypothetical protein L2E82_49404 [Cichorium intybus]
MPRHRSPAGIPPKQGHLKEFKNIVKETFSSDDPLRPFEDQPNSRQFMLGLQSLFLILEWVRNYSLKKVSRRPYCWTHCCKSLYSSDSSIVPPLIYGVMGSSHDIATGPVVVVSFLLRTLLQTKFDPVKNAVGYHNLAFITTFLAGITQATLGFLR